MKKVFKIIMKIVNIVVITMVILFISMVCLQRFSGNKISFFNFRIFTVITGSMKPKYDVGDVLISKETAPSKIKVGDVISYLGKTGSFANKVITHEVIDIEKNDSGKLVFHAKGTANLVEDPYVYEDQLYGVVIYKSVILSFIYKIVGTTYGVLIFVIVPIFYIIGSEIVSSMLEREEKRRSNLTKQ